MQNFSQLENFILSQVKPFTLATVIEVTGSSYRKPGAKMLIGSKGETRGQVGGGCFDKDVISHALNMEVGKARTIEYDLGTEEDLYLGTGTGCPGKVKILLEKYGVEDIHELSKGFGLRHHPKSKITILSNGEEISSYSQWDFDMSIVNVFKQNKLTAVRKSSHVEIVDPLNIQPSLYVFGNGEDAYLVREFAEKLGWNVEIFSLLQDQLILSENLKKIELQLSSKTAAIAMTHNYQSDAKILKSLARLDLAYLGIMGAKQRFDQLMYDLKEDVRAKVVKGPIGLNTGGRTPPEIALSIIAEIQSVQCLGDTQVQSSSSRATKDLHTHPSD